MLVNDECTCTSWYSREGDFLLLVCDRRKEVLYGAEPVCVASQTNLTSMCMASGTECCGGLV